MKYLLLKILIVLVSISLIIGLYLMKINFGVIVGILGGLAYAKVEIIEEESKYTR